MKSNLRSWYASTSRVQRTMETGCSGMAKAVMEHLNISRAFETRVIYLKENEPLRIGRPKSDEIINKANALFNSKSVSIVHAYLNYSSGKFTLEDRSRNGTFINGYKLRPKKQYSLISGDIIELGTEAFFNEDNGLGTIIFIKLFCLDEEDLRDQCAVQQEYPHPVQLYSSPPLFEVNVENLLTCTYERLRVFQIISKLGYCESKGNGWIEEVMNKLKDSNMTDYYEMITGAVVSSKVECIQRKKDHISHYILLMACSQSTPIEKWFIELESRLLLIRWHFLSKNEKEEFLRLNNLLFNKISNTKKQEIVGRCGEFISLELDYYEVSFKDVPRLVSQREVIINNGIAFITFDQLIHPIITFFSYSLSTKLKIAKKNYQHFCLDERIFQLLTQVTKFVKYENQSTKFEGLKKVSILHIDKLCKESFPLCMERLHNKLCTDSHLRNGGRYQYTLFLKGIGVSSSDAIQFWKSHFTKRMTSNHFVKEYLYHIRHCYGIVGKQADYPPLSCNKILNANPGPLDIHGCPFKTESKSEIMKLLEQKGINKIGAVGVLEIMEKGLPQVACNKVFELIHGFSPTNSTFHPNDYYLASRKIFQGNKREFVNASNFTNKPNQCVCKNNDLEW